MRTVRQAFTLIELLTVIAITAVLMTLIVVPVFQSFNLTRAAQAFADAQDKARQLVEAISREVGTSVRVRDGSGRVSTTLNGATVSLLRSTMVAVVPGVNTDGTAINGPQPGDFVEVQLPNSKLDLVRPAEGEIDPTLALGTYRDPVTGKIDPTLHQPKGQIILPVGPGQAMTRYFVALRDPMNPKAYVDPYNGLLMTRTADRDNLYVLFRANVQPMQFRLVTPAGGGANRMMFVSNPDFFEVAPGTQKGVDVQTGLPVGDPQYDDPRFFVPNRDGAGNVISNDAKATRIANWLKVSVIKTEVSRYDMIQPIYDKSSRKVSITGTINQNSKTLGLPDVVPLISFAPTRVSSDPAKGQVAVRPGEEGPNGEIVEPDVYLTQFGQWSNFDIRTWPVGWDPTNPGFNELQIGVETALAGTPGNAPGFSLYGYDPDLGPESSAAAVKELFDVSTYDLTIRQGGRYPFSAAVFAANGRSNWLSNQRMREIFTPYFVDPTRGKLVASFSISDIGDPTKTPTNPQNLPSVDTADINTAFTGNWAAHPELRPDIQRFVYLAVTPNSDGTMGVLNPDPTIGFARARITPGAETVYGPDQMIGPNQGQIVRYTRTTSPNPGPNQYKMNYVNQSDPDLLALGFSQVDVDAYNALNGAYSPTNFISSVIIPRYRAGYIQLNSDPNVQLPAGQITVSYRFQFTGGRSTPGTGSSTDVFAVDYDSRQLMSVLLTMRNYAQSNLPNPQMVTLKATATVRNYTR